MPTLSPLMMYGSIQPLHPSAVSGPHYTQQATPPPTPLRRPPPLCPPARRRSMHLCKCSQIDLLMVGEGRETGEADGLSDGGD